MARTITLEDHDVQRVARALNILASWARDDAQLARDLGYPVTAANHDDEATACRLIITRLTDTTEA